MCHPILLSASVPGRNLGNHVPSEASLRDGLQGLSNRLGSLARQQVLIEQVEVFLGACPVTQVDVGESIPHWRARDSALTSCMAA